MKNLRKLLFVISLLFITSFVNAQYLISAAYITQRNAIQIDEILTDLGWDTSPMELNGAVIYKVTYNTTDVFGEPTIASGALYVPQVECDTLPLVSYHHGTVFHKEYVPSNTYAYDAGFMYSGNGYITTLPDYLGLGDNPGLHPYVHWESEATVSIDLIRAAREFLNGTLSKWDNNQLFLTGYSQGGHSTMAFHKYVETNNLQSEFNIIASAPMSGPFPLYDAQLPEMFGGDSTYYRAEFVPYVIGAYQMVYGNLYENYNEYYDPPYDSIIEDWLISGIHDANEWYNLIPDNFYDFMQDSVVDNFINNPNHPLNVALRANDLHNWAPQEPVRMLYCGMDSMVYAQNSMMALDTMLALGATDVQALDLDPTGIHETCWAETYIYALEWFDSLRVECEMVNVSCSPDGITFTTQAEIDSFQTDHPNCTEIEGDVTISGDSITNLNGLSVLTSIGGDLQITSNSSLASLIGLENVTSIGGDLQIYWNDALTNLTGLDNITTIGGGLLIGLGVVPPGGPSDTALTSLTGLEGLTSIGGSISISDQAALTSLTGLDNVTSIGGNISIYNNNLTSLTGLEGLTSINGYLLIYANYDLISLSGLENVTSIGGNLNIVSNHTLTNLTGIDNVTSIEGNILIGSPPDNSPGFLGNDSLTNLSGLEGLTSIVGDLNILGNNLFSSLTGLNNVTSIGGDLDISGNNSLASLTGLDNVMTIEGNVSVGWDAVSPGYGNASLISLTGLDNLTSIGENFSIYNNNSLTNLTGLENLTSIEGDLSIGTLDDWGGSSGNPALLNLSGLENLTSIAGTLSISSNDTLTSLTGLDYVNSVGGDIVIDNNNVLTVLSGLDNINAATIENLSIYNNNLLSFCEVQSICDYLISPNGTVEIHNNSLGCNSQVEVEEACDAITVVKINEAEIYSIYPNPVEGILTFSSEDITSIEIYNMMGVLIIRGNSNKVDMSNLNPGIYFAVGFDLNLHPLYKGKIIKK